MPDDVFLTITRIVHESVKDADPSILQESTSLESLGVNSMSRIHIIGRIEKAFAVEFEADELIGEQLDTIGGLCDCIVRKIS